MQGGKLSGTISSKIQIDLKRKYESPCVAQITRFLIFLITEILSVKNKLHNFSIRKGLFEYVKQPVNLLFNYSEFLLLIKISYYRTLQVNFKLFMNNIELSVAIHMFDKYNCAPENKENVCEKLFNIITFSFFFNAFFFVNFVQRILSYLITVFSIYLLSSI